MESMKTRKESELSCQGYSEGITSVGSLENWEQEAKIPASTRWNSRTGTSA